MSPSTRRSPYQGLIPYTEADAAWFFGRDADRAVVLDNLLAYRVSILFGTSGVGKSSLLRAGVVREVRDDARRRIADGEPAEYLALHFSSWAEEPIGGLQRAIITALADVSPQLAEGLPEGGSLADTVAAAAARVDGALLVILDQFEEYFLYHDADGPFIRQLAGLLAKRDTAASVMIAIREDSLAKLDALAAHMPGLLENLVRIDHLDREAARAAIVEPVALWNREQGSADEAVQIEPALVEAVLDGVQNEASRIQTPYLQVVLTRLWDEERGAGSRVLRLSTLEKRGGTERIVAEHVDQAIASLSPAEQATAAAILRQLVTSSGTKIARGPGDLAELTGLDEGSVTAVLERLTREGRILQAVGGGRYEIYHDALAEPIIEWRQRWQARQDRLRERRRDRIVAAVAAGLVATVVVVATLAILAWRAQRDAERQARDARGVALASAARDQVESQPDVALLLGLAGLRERDRYETRSSVIAARQAAGPESAAGIIRGHDDTVHGAVFLNRGRTLASAGSDGRIILSDVATHRQVGRPLFSDRRIPLTSLAISPDERYLAAGDGSGFVRFFEIATRRLLRSVDARGLNLDAIAFSPDGRMLAAAAEGSPIRLWTVPALRPAGRPLTTPDEYTFSIAFSPDGRTLASVGERHQVLRWNLRSRGRVRGVLAKPREQITSVTFSPDGRTLATGGRQALLWNLKTGVARAMILGPTEPAEGGRVDRVAFSPDGRRLAGAGEDGATRLWDVRTRREVRPPMRGPTARLEGVAFSADSDVLAAFGVDKKIWLMDTTRAAELDLGGRLDDHAFDRAGGTLATALDGRRIRFWDVRSGRVTRESRVDSEQPSLAVLGDGAGTLATSSPHGQLAVWTLRTPVAAAARLGRAGEGLFGLAFSARAGLLATADNGGTITLWDVASKRRRGKPLRSRGSFANAVALSTDGRLLAAADADGVRVWELTEGKQPLLKKSFADAGVLGLTFSPDGRTLATTRGARIELAEISTGGTNARLQTGEALALDVEFVPDGRTLIASYEQGAVRLWDVASRRQLGQPLGGHEPVDNVAVSPDGRTFASDGDGFTVRLWSRVLWRDKGELRDEICDLVGTDLSRREWAQYAPGVEYRRVCDR